MTKERGELKSVDIRHPEILKFLGKCASTGMSWPGVVRAIEKEYDVRTTPAYVKKVYETYVQRRTEIIEGNEELKEDIKNEILNWKDQIHRINQATWEIINNLDTDPDKKIKAMAEVRKQLDLQNKILDRMETNITQQDMNKIEMTKFLFAQLKKLESDGMIKILAIPGQGVKLAEIIDTKTVEEEDGTTRTD